MSILLDEISRIQDITVDIAYDLGIVVMGYTQDISGQTYAVAFWNGLREMSEYYTEEDGVSIREIQQEALDNLTLAIASMGTAILELATQVKEVAREED